jgi:hypothetical protein
MMKNQISSEQGDARLKELTTAFMESENQLENAKTQVRRHHQGVHFHPLSVSHFCFL